MVGFTPTPTQPDFPTVASPGEVQKLLLLRGRTGQLSPVEEPLPKLDQAARHLLEVVRPESFTLALPVDIHRPVLLAAVQAQPSRAAQILYREDFVRPREVVVRR